MLIGSFLLTRYAIPHQVIDCGWTAR